MIFFQLQSSFASFEQEFLFESFRAERQNQMPMKAGAVLVCFNSSTNSLTAPTGKAAMR